MSMDGLFRSKSLQLHAVSVCEDFLHGAMVRLTYSDEAHSCLLWTMLNKMEVDFNVLTACSNVCNLLAML